MQFQNEKTLIQSCISNDARAQEELFLRYSERLYTTCIRYLADVHDAEDVIQETFINIFKYISNYNPKLSSLITWMNKICVNECLKKLKSRDKVKTLKLAYHNEKHQSTNEGLQSLNYNDILNEIILLPEPYRTVFNLFEIEGYTHKEIAQMLEINPNNSRAILFRAKSQLKLNLKPLLKTGIN